ncbi:MAG: MFS transporter [Anaerolineaceae bacterium]|nr:MAG: MFS transporter [Anaerolineaceae bacterium]
MITLFADKRRTLIFLLISNFLLHFGFQVWRTMINNFAVEEIGIGPASIGWLQALREVPGLMGFLLGFLALFISEVRIMSLSVILLGAGIFLTGQATNIPFLLISAVVMSIGFHFFIPCNDGVILMTIEKEQTPKALGQLRSLGAISALTGTVMVYLLAEGWGYRTLFMVLGGFIVVSGLLLLPLGSTQEGLPQRRQVILRRRYWLFYLLAFMMGSRRHIFTTFAVFLLVREHGISVQTTALLFTINSLVSVYTMQLMGKLVGRLGERLMLSIAFSALGFVFLGYAFVSYLPALFVLFVLDNILFGFNLALATYFQKIAITQEEITSNLAVQQSINHIAAIVMPVVGGTAWELFGSQAPFLVGVGIALVSLVLVQFLRVPVQRPSVPVGTPTNG